MNVDLIVALVTLLGTLIVLTWNIIDRSRSSFEERMSKATDFLTGGTQKRSAGIATISSSRKRLARHREVAWRTAIILLLCTQAIYLLEQSDEGDRPDEILNLRRIVELLIAFNFQSSEQVEGAMLAKRIKNDLQGASKRPGGLDRTQVKKMTTESPIIGEWPK
jgi:hypothetical protein